MLTKQIFVSDVHLGAFPKDKNDEIEHDLIKLIEYCEHNQIKINILGDLFDYWMEFPEKDFIPALGSKILEAFERYNHKVTPALYITGNHDNWTFGHFEDLGFDIEDNFRFLELDDIKILIMHGDGVASNKIDFPRATFHRILRNSTFVEVYQKLFTPKSGLAAMKTLSNLTRKRNHQDPVPLNEQAKKIFNKHNLDYIISGHDHIPRVETFSRGSYINLGAFFNTRTIAVYNNHEIELVMWEAKSNSIIPFTGN